MSDVQRLLAEIDNEYTSAQQGLYGLAQGTARHAFISARYDRIGELQGQLDNLVGHEQAMHLVIDQLNKGA
jgi:hypothetical protein